MTKIKIKKSLKPKQVPLYKNNKLIGYVFENQLRDIQVQIYKNKLSGYYVIFKNKKINIKEDGRFDQLFPNGFLNISYTLVKQLFS